MKNKLFCLLLIFGVSSVFVSCGDDDKPVEYLDPDLIAGKWYMINTADSTVRLFQNAYSSATVYNRYTKEPVEVASYGKYQLTQDKIIIGNRTGNDYRLNVDSLWITEGGRRMVQYRRVK